MIPILYEGNATTYLHNGLGRLSDAISCTVEEERNGTFELAMEYPIDGIHYSDIQENRIILAKTEDGGTNQAFIIYKISKPLNGIVTINAQHVSYLLNGYIVMPYQAVSLADAMSKINTNAVLNTGFTFSTDISSAVHFKLEQPRNIRNLLGGESGSFLDVYGGYDYKFDNFNVQLLASRGRDNGVTIRYGKNMTELKAVSNTTNVYTGIVPFWTDNEGHTVYLDGNVVYSDHAATYPYKYIKVVDFSNEFEEQPTSAQLLAKAESYLSNNDGWQIKSNIEVSFVSLATTDEYKDVAPLERVKLCDTVTVQYSKLGISFKTKVIKTVYNVLLDRYDSITLGDSTYTLAQALQQANDTPTVQETQSAIQRAVNNATNLIRGGLGGHVVMVADGNGLPQEILIMDTEDITTAQKVWRWNMGGLGYSSSGYDGEYGTAITMDGQIVANYITAGTFNGALIEAGTIAAEALSVAAKESLQSIHNYIGDVFNDISLWQYVGIAPYYETIDGKKYLVIDGTNPGSADRVYTPISISGNNKMEIHFKYHIDNTITISQQRFPFINYTNMDGNNWYSWRNIPAQTIPADTDFEWDISLTPNNADATKPAYFGFYRFAGCKIYIEELTVKSTVDSYAQAGMTFNSNGLELMAEEVRGNYAHNYLPYDIMSNASRWAIDTPGAALSFGSTTYQGQVYETAFLDAQNISSGYMYATFKLNSDVVGKPLMHIKFIFHFNPAFTVTSSTPKDFLKIQYKHDSSGYTQETIYTLPEQAYVPTTETEVELDFTPSLTVDRYEATPEIWFNVPNGAQIVIFGIEIYSDGETYKKASLSFTADGLNSVVQAGSIISTINQSAESVDINASKINLTGDLSLRGDFTSYDPNDNTTYAFMDSGSISFFNQGSNVFTVASLPLLGSNAGIFFGDADDAATLNRYTYLTQEFLQTPTLLCRKDGSQTVPTGAGQALIEGDFSVYGQATFYGNVYNNSGSVVFISDKRKKKNIKDLVIEKARSFIMGLRPRQYRFKQPAADDCVHHGFIAQELREAMSDDWAVYCDDKDVDFFGIRYNELFADMVKVMQDQEKRIEALERAVYDKSINKS